MLDLVVLNLLGLFIIAVGVYFWKKYDSNKYVNVEKSKKIFYEEKGRALIFLGAGCMFKGTLDYLTDTDFGSIVFALCFIACFVIFIKGQMNYNNS